MTYWGGVAIELRLLQLTTTIRSLTPPPPPKTLATSTPVNHGDKLGGRLDSRNPEVLPFSPNWLSSCKVWPLESSCLLK